MKKTIFIVLLIGIIASISSRTFGQDTIKIIYPCKDIVEIKDEKQLIKARLAADADYKKFKTEAETNICDNEFSIEDLRAANLNYENATKERYFQKITDLEMENNILKKKIYHSFRIKTCAWPAFKDEFYREMYRLQLEIMDMEDRYIE